MARATVLNNTAFNSLSFILWSHYLAKRNCLRDSKVSPPRARLCRGQMRREGLVPPPCLGKVSLLTWEERWRRNNWRRKQVLGEEAADAVSLVCQTENEFLDGKGQLSPGWVHSGCLIRTDVLRGTQSLVRGPLSHLGSLAWQGVMEGRNSLELIPGPVSGEDQDTDTV